MRGPFLAAVLTAAAFIPPTSFAQQPAIYASQQVWAGAPLDAAGRIAWLDERIRMAIADGTLPGKDGRRALRKLSMLRQQERGMSHRDGQLSPRAAAKVQARLDDVLSDLRWSNTY